jgi:glycosyltransferase involved in cell wall biosynthesis
VTLFNPNSEAFLNGEKGPGLLVSIIIPAYNEEKNLGNVLSELKRYAKLVQMENEIIVVDDGSVDKTKEVATQNGAKVLVNKTNQGKGYSLKCGFKFAKGKIVITMDADGSHDPKDIGKLVFPVLNGTDIAVGSRFNTKEGKKTTTRVNLFGNRLISLFFLIITGNIITDTQSGFRAYKSEVLKKIAVTSKRFEVETELTLKPIMSGFSMKEVPIFVRKRNSGISHVNPIKDGLKIMKQMICWLMIYN